MKSRLASGIMWKITVEVYAQNPYSYGVLYRFQIKDEIKAARIEATKAYIIVR
jgi:hypothetical protein